MIRGLGWIVAALLVAAATCGCHSDRPASRGPIEQARQELEVRYRENEAGFFAKDPDRVMSLRHPGFHTILPNGTVNSREQMAQRTRDFIGRIERFDSLSERITRLSLSGDTAMAMIDQSTVRQQRIEGALHEVRTSVTQRESWIKTKDGWLMWRVDSIQPGATLLDGRPLPPSP